MSASPAGWYPQEDGRLRYWDGQQWTEHFAPGQAPSPTGAPAPMVQGAAADVKAPRPWFRKRILIPAGLLALVVFGSALSGGDGTEGVDAAPVAADSSSSATSAPAAKVSPRPTAKGSPKAAPATNAPAAKPAPPKSQVGKAVRDGKFAFTVRSVKCGIPVVGDNPYLQEKAQGQFCAVQLTVENIGDEPQSMFADNQHAFDTKGRRFSANSMASMADESSQVLWEEINPGNAVKGTVYFDIPKGAKLTSLELHDSAFSGGVKVRL
ncbi:DUF4352 domain-containing protein [Knoellia sp. p5-6-4]|uniref:DUF4352 domain-containing protein n=1 Tax=unclassified Knoellia TaxID=2618719 RepID=UPI0023DC004A|nr:DUF4352 domain-containing protein [Knoellia sp. p5-6-4]MDF2143826.1 DUF4352 domain-containing protein [Knoellia sp. p5-6-4]